MTFAILSFPRDINCLDHSTSKLGSQFSSCKMTNCWLELIILFTFHLAVFALWNSTWHDNASLDDPHLTHNNEICLKRACQMA